MCAHSLAITNNNFLLRFNLKIKIFLSSSDNYINRNVSLLFFRSYNGLLLFIKKFRLTVHFLEFLEILGFILVLVS